MPSPKKLLHGPEHVNNNLICAIDIRVGGTDPMTSDLLEICVLPLNHSFKVSVDFGLFHTKIQPAWPVDRKVSGLGKEALVEHTSAPDSVLALEMFERWFFELNLPKHKKIMPLVWDWSHVFPYLKIWMPGSNFGDFIHESVRECLPLLNYVNDRQSLMGQEVTFKHPTFGQLCARSGVEHIERNSVLSNCKALSDAYRHILGLRLP